jgi:hypothetical protein
MNMHRRALLGAIGAGVAASAAAQGQAPAAAPPAQQQGLEAQIAARALERRHRLDFANGRFSGPAYDMMVEEGRASQFFCIGEEHGIAENPKLAAQLFMALTSAGYSKACVEISPPMAGELDRAARGGLEGIRAMFADPRANVAFFGMREEAEWIAAARAAAPGRTAVWGLDYEVGGWGRILDRLAAKPKPAAAATAFAAMQAEAETLSAQFAQSRAPQHLYSFAGDPELVRATRAAWRRPDSEADWMLATLEETLVINRYWVTQQGWMSNEARARFNRANLRRYWNAEREKPRVMFKFGMSHMVRGVSHTQVFDIGTQISEMAEAMASKSYHVAVLPGAGTRHARMNVQTWRYEPAETSQYAEMGMAPLLAAAYPDAMTLIDLRAVRPLVGGRRAKTLDGDLVRMVHGFDALLIMTGSTPSENL